MDKRLEDLLRDYERIWAVDQASSLLNWDLETYMPEKAAQSRGLALSQLSAMRQNFILSLKDRVEGLNDENLDEDRERGIVRVLRRELHFYESIPQEILKRFHTLTTEATVVWRHARQKSDFALFKPYLQEIVQINLTIAEKLGYTGNPYNALLDLFEEGLTIADVDMAFSTLVPASRDIFSSITRKGYFSAPSKLERWKYNVERMRQLNSKVLKILGMPTERFRMDVSSHPFTTGISVDDVRITTRYEGRNFKASLFSTIHESGHAIYELQISKDLERTPTAHGASSAVHESQSRFWENFIGRNRDFVNLLFPELREVLHVPRSYDNEEMYRYFNTVRPTFIRVDADEVTYNFHIALRYEAEKKMINGEIDPSEIPEFWNDTMERYLGVRPGNDSEGVLQDIHWSGGSFGYFPTYSLGNVVAGMIWGKHDFAKDIETWNPGGIKKYLEEKIHRFGSTYAPKDLLIKSFGEGYNSEYLISYLRKKYEV